MKLLYGEDAAVAEWVAAQIPHMPTGFKDFAAIGVTDKNKIVGGIVFHEYRVNDIQISCASTSNRWLSKSILRAFFTYPFIQLNCDRVTSFVPSKNTGTRDFIDKVGFVEEGLMRRGFVSDDCVIFGMLREECKWIKDK